MSVASRVVSISPSVSPPLNSRPASCLNRNGRARRWVTPGWRRRRRRSKRASAPCAPTWPTPHCCSGGWPVLALAHSRARRGCSAWCPWWTWCAPAQTVVPLVDMVRPRSDRGALGGHGAPPLSAWCPWWTWCAPAQTVVPLVDMVRPRSDRGALGGHGAPPLSPCVRACVPCLMLSTSR
jgi:hypothetical protein